ncbi:MAG: 3-methylfumaryl-CoA hydratase [Candidatus Binatota bacterium]|jgi:hypothetical protein|nr:3-methylfumaryl-CoA hydratase [Candidatus Binatota bacterium]
MSGDARGSLPFGIESSVLGEEFEVAVSEPVTREEILEYSASVGEPPQVADDDVLAPPTFCICFRGNRFFHPSIPTEVFLRGFDAGKDIAFGAPIRVGDVITGRNVLHDLYEKTGRSGTMTFIVSRNTLTNQRDEMVAVIDSRFVVRSEAKPDE